MSTMIGGGCGPERSRSQMAASKEPSVRLNNGRLVVNGTNHADNISVTKSGGSVVVKSGDQVLGTFPADQVKDVRVRGHRGKDAINVAGFDKDTFVKVRGGRGGDSITLDNDRGVRVRGGRGNDVVNVNGGGENHVRTGRGADQVDVEKSDGNTIRTRRGKDEVKVAGNDNRVFGGRGDDDVDVDGENDEVDLGMEPQPMSSMPGFLAMPRRC